MQVGCFMISLFLRGALKAPVITMCRLSVILHVTDYVSLYRMRINSESVSLLHIW
jgi:hypothetical protein